MLWPLFHTSRFTHGLGGKGLSFLSSVRLDNKVSALCKPFAVFPRGWGYLAASQNASERAKAREHNLFPRFWPQLDKTDLVRYNVLNRYSLSTHIEFK